MDDEAIRRIVQRISSEGPYVISGKRVVRKADLSSELRMPLLQMMGLGYVVIKNGHVRLTPKGVRARGDEKLRSATYTRRMKDRGCVRKSLWVHPDDIEKFEEFTATLKGPNDE